MKPRYLTLSLMSGLCAVAMAQQGFSLRQEADSTYTLRLQTADGEDTWRLPWPVYRLCVADVDGDGSDDALVGVVKATRFYPEVGRRLFIFKNLRGRIRPLWMGSRLGGELADFRTLADEEGSVIVRALERTADGRYVVADYRWDHFGLGFVQFVAKNVDEEEALRVFNVVERVAGSEERD